MKERLMILPKIIEYKTLPVVLKKPVVCLIKKKDLEWLRSKVKNSLS